MNNWSEIFICVTVCLVYSFRWTYCSDQCDGLVHINYFSRTTTIFNTTEGLLTEQVKCLNDAAESGNIWIMLVRASNINISHLLDVIDVKITSQIRTIDIRGNNMSVILRNTFNNLANVDHIILQENRIQYLEEGSFCNLTKLRKIDLSGNILNGIQSGVFCNLPNLREIHLSHNRIKHIDDTAFIWTPKVYKILLTNNIMTTLPYKAFENMPLQELGMSWNNIAEITDDIRHFKSLRILRIENNGLQQVSRNIATLPNLVHMYLGNNNLTFLSKDFAYMVNATIVRGIDSNPWRCNCDLYWMIQLVVLGLPSSNQVQCWEPVHINMSDFDIQHLNCNKINNQNGIQPAVLFGLTAVLLIGLSAIVFAIYVWKRRTVRPRRHIKMMINTRYYQPQNTEGDSSGESTVFLNTCKTSMLVIDEMITWEQIYCEKRPLLGELKVGKLLGRGAFGDVYEAFTFGNDTISDRVAVKKIRETATQDETGNLRKELQNMKEIGTHPNIIQIFGSGCTHGCPIIVMELAEHGDLLRYLHKLEASYHLEIERLESWQERSYLVDKMPRLFSIVWNVAKGMEYMSQMKIVHRDLAARNILLGEHFVAKISDFGLSRDVYESGIYSQKSKGRLPYKWMSPETLSTGKFTTKSDVWSYGVLLWEVVTLGSSPYPGIPPHMLIDMYNSGYIMPRPPLCPANIYSVMERCWKYTPEDRPLFRSIVEYLNNLLQLGYNQEYLELLDNQSRQLNGVMVA